MEDKTIDSIRVFHFTSGIERALSFWADDEGGQIYCMKLSKEKLFAEVVFIIMLSMIAACGRSNGEIMKSSKSLEVVEELAPEYSYVAEYLTVPEDNDFYATVFYDNTVIGEKDTYDEETSAYRVKLVKTTINDYELSEEQEFITFDEGKVIDRYCMDDKGNLIVLLQLRPELPEDVVHDDAFYEEYYENYNKYRKYHLAKYDLQGTCFYEIDVTEYLQGGDYLYVSFMAADGSGNLCVFAEGVGAVLFNANGEYLGTIPSESYLQGMGNAKDGSVYCSIVENDVNKTRCILRKIDFEKLGFGEELMGFPYLYGSYCVLQPGIDGDMFFFDQDALYEYSLERQETTKILTWMDCDIDGTVVKLVAQGNDGKLYVLIRQWDGEGMELASLKKVSTEELVKRERITIGVLYSDYNLGRQLVEFNKKSDKYHVSVKSYMDMNDWSDTSYQDAVKRLYDDIASGYGPDIISLEGLDIQKLVKIGALEDLTPYLKSSSEIDKNDIFESLLKGATYGKVLAYLPSHFTLSTLVAKQSVVGNKSNWTYRDMMELVQKYPDAELIQYGGRSSMLDVLMKNAYDHYIDRDKNECNFDTDEFREMLEFAKSFPEEADYTYRPAPILLKNNSLLVETADLYDFQEVQQICAYFDGEQMNFIGYPGYGDGNGCLITVMDQYGILSNASNKEGAWAVLEKIYSFSMEDTDYSYWGFPSSKSKFEELKQNEFEAKYAYEDDGSLMLDGKAQPVYENGYSYTLIGDDGSEWNYEYSPLTPEEADIVERLLSGAKVVDQDVDADLFRIIHEETQAYFQDNKSLDEVVEIIQNRISLYLNENN